MIDPKPYLLAALLCVGAWYVGRSTAPTPEVPLVPVTGLSLRGQFIGPTAAQDAAQWSALCDEMAVKLETDGKKDAPWITTGLQVETLRTCAREAMLDGVSLSARQPHVKKLVGDYMTQKLPINPGELTNRADWVSVFHDIARAAADAAK